MTGSLLIPEARIDEILTEVPELGEVLPRVPLVAVSSAMYRDPEGKDKPRYQAALDTADSSRDMRVRHIMMVDDSSPEQVGDELHKAGAIVVRVRHETEGGVVRPYLTAARLIDRVNRDALMVKAEPEKPVFDYRGNNYVALVEAAHEYDVITGVRGQATFDSMPYYLRLTESVLATAIRDLTSTYDAASGVLALTASGREVFYQTTDPEWQYLIKVPAAARAANRSVGEVEIDFDYHHLVVLEEDGNEGIDGKRRRQFRLMLNCAIEAAGGEDKLDTRQRRSVASARNFIAALQLLAERD